MSAPTLPFVRRRWLRLLRGRPALLGLLTVASCAGLVVALVPDFSRALNAAVAPGGAYVVQVTAEGTSCSFRYPEGFTVHGDFVVPKGRVIRLVLSSADPGRIQIPTFGVASRMDPELYRTAWFKATELGAFSLRCSAGLDAAANTVRVVGTDDFEDWIDRGGDGVLPEAEYGRRLFAKMGCEACHSLEDKTGIGPSLRGLLGRAEKLTGGREVLVDREYLRESITDPAAKVANGFAPIMPTLPRGVRPGQIDAIVSFLSTEPSQVPLP